MLLFDQCTAKMKRKLDSTDEMVALSVRKAQQAVRRRGTLPFSDMEIPPALHQTVFGDYLSANKLRPNRSKRAVVQSAGYVPTALSIVNTLQHTVPEASWSHTALVSSLNNLVIGQSPAEIVSKAEAGFLLTRSFPILQVGEYLDQSDRSALLGAVPTLASTVREHRGHKLLSFRACLARSDITSSEFYYINRLLTTYCSGGRGQREFLRALKQYMQSAMNADSTISYIVFSLREQARVARESQARRQELITELKNWGLKLRSDSSYCQAFIEGSESADVQEVAAIMYMTSKLFQIGGHIAFSNLHVQFKQQIRLRVRHEQQTWQTAAHAVIAENTEVIRSSGSDGDFYDDFF
jgi:hypothetical protein